MAAQAELKAANRRIVQVPQGRQALLWALRSAVAGLLAFAALPAQAEVPGALALQGRLTNAAGFPVPDGDYGLTLRFYAQPSETKPVWTYVDPGVKVVKGIFVLGIGDKLPLDKKEFLNGNAGYVSVQIGSEAELGKLPLHPVAYALRAEVAASAKGLDCSGCLTSDHLDPAVLAPFAKSAGLAKLATTGSWDDLADKPKLVLLGQTCSTGQVVGGIDAAGKVVCSANPTYSGSNFAVSNQGCGAGNVVTGIDAAGKVTCAKDGGASYDGGDFALSAQSCPSGQMVAGIGADGKVVCAADKDTNTTYTGKDFAVSGQACAPGQVVYSIDGSGKIQCANDKDTVTTYSGKDFALANQGCLPGQVVVAIGANGAVTCAADGDTKYSGVNFAVSNQSCTAGQVVAGIGADGKVVCAADKDTDTKYTGANFATSSQTCPAGQVVTGINGSGAVTCAADTDTKYSGANFATSSQTCPAGQVVTGISGSGAVTCAADKDTDTNTTYSGANFATSNQACGAGQVVTGINSSGGVTCAADKDTNAGGTVTSIAAGTGLTGGTITTSGTIAADTNYLATLGTSQTITGTKTFVANAAAFTGTHAYNGSSATFAINPTKYVVSQTNAYGYRSTKAIDTTTLAALCGDVDGCNVTIGMYNWDGTGETAARGPYKFFYNTSNNHWRISDTDTSGIDGNGGTQHVLVSWSCYFTDATYVSGTSNNDTTIGFGLLNWTEYPALTTECRLIFED